MKILKSLISVLLIITVMMSITGSAIHIHHCFSTGNLFFDFHFPTYQLNSLNHCDGNCHDGDLCTEGQTKLFFKHQSLCCKDIISSSDIDETYHFVKYTITFNSPEFEIFGTENQQMMLSGKNVSNMILPRYNNTSPPEIITTRILLL